MPALPLVELALVDEDPRNPRGDLGDLTALKMSIAQSGLLEPLELIARPNGRYFLHEGHRRRQALLDLGEQHAPWIEVHFDSELDRLYGQGAIHLHRKSFNPMAWARYCRRLWDAPHNQTRDQIAMRLGVSTNFVRDHLAFMHLLPYEQHALERGEMTRKEALRHLTDRRDMRDGRPPTPAKTAPAKKATKPAAPTTRPAGEPHLNDGHRLAAGVTARCTSAGREHATRPKIGGVGCGQCWEEGIRDDALSTVNLALAAA